MLKILKRIMGKKEPDLVDFNNAEEWLALKLKNSDIREKLSDVFDSISFSLKNIEKILIDIRNITIENISKEQLQVVEEYTKNHFSSMNHFIKQLIYRETRDFDAIINYAENMHVVLKEANSLKEKAVIKKFYSKQHDELEKELESLAKMQKDLSELIKQKNGLAFISQIKKKIKNIEYKRKRKAEIEAQVEREEIKKKDAEDYKLKLETELDDLKTTEDYADYDKLLSNKFKLEKELERENAAVSALFSPLIKLFKEYDAKDMGADRVLARTYAENHLNAFANDENLWILSLLQSVSAKLPELELNETKRMKARQNILALNEDFLRQASSKILQIKENLRELQKQIMSNNITRKIDDIKYKMNHADQQKAIFEKNREECEKELYELSVEKDLLRLEKDLCSFGEVKLR